MALSQKTWGSNGSNQRNHGGKRLNQIYRNHNRILHIGGPRDRDLPKPGLAGADCPYRQDGHPWGSISTMSQQHINDIGWLKFQFLTAFINRNDMKWLWLWIPPLAEKTTSTGPISAAAFSSTKLQSLQSQGPLLQELRHLHDAFGLDRRGPMLFYDPSE